MKIRLLLVALLAVAACAAPTRPPAPAVAPAMGMAGVEARHLDPGFWIAQQAHADVPLLDRAGIAAQNARMQALDPAVRDLEQLPASLGGDEVRGWIAKLSKLPSHPLYDEQGSEVPKATLAAIAADLALDAVPAEQPTRYGLIVARADQRSFPTTLRVFNTRGETDIDRFQENALFPGTPVAIVHQSRDRAWYFVVSPLYAAWVEQRFVAEGPAAQVFGYGRKTPYLVVTGDKLRTVHTREAPPVSELQLDMGVRVPMLADWPQDRPVNGQGALSAHVIELPVRADDGTLRFVPALLPKQADVARDYLPLTRAGVLRQGFKFLGERYGWGHAYNGRDCSGFVSEVYRSFGVVLPRNTRDQAVSPALERIGFDQNSDRASRLAAVSRLQVGDLIYIPGHVMMVIGFDAGEPYVIHDTNGASFRGGDGGLRRLPLNGVVVTPLRPLLFNQTESYIDRMTSIQRIPPQAGP